MSSSRYIVNPVVLLATPTLENRPISWDWMDYNMNLQFPLGAAVSRLRIHGKDVAEARNAIVQSALEMGAHYVLMLGDDNLAPPNLFALLARHKEYLVTGVYWQKCYPTHPYLWDGLLKGFYEDWKLGEYFPVDFGGCDALLAHTDVFRAIEPPWFSRDWTFEEGQKTSPILTEDFYFYTKARQAGFRLWVDTEAQLDHQDRASGIRFGLQRDMPQYFPDAPHPSADPVLLVADIGGGTSSPWISSKAVIKRYDLDPDTNPDVRCDIRAIPEPDQTFDVVTTRHTLEHFMWEEAPKLVVEWTRILKVGGQFRVNVPNLAAAAREIVKADEDASYNPGLYPLWQVYGRQVGAYGEIHRNGFTRHGLRSLLEACGLGDVKVEVTGDYGENLDATAIKVSHPKPMALGPAWRDIEQREATPIEADNAVDADPGTRVVEDAPIPAITPVAADAVTTEDAVERLNGRESALEGAHA